MILSRPPQHACLWSLAALSLALAASPVPLTAEEKTPETDPAARAAAAPATATVHLTNGHRLIGTILAGAPPSSEFLLLKTEHGQVTLPRKNVVSIDGDFSVQLQALEKNDYRGRLELALAAYEAGDAQVALEIVASQARSKNYDEVGRRLRAELTDEIHGGEAALPLYREYEKKGGKNADAIERLRQLEKAQADYKKELAAFEASQKNKTQQSGNQATAGTSAQQPPRIAEGLEASAGWSKEAEEFANPTSVSVVPLGGVDKDHVLRMQAAPGQRGKGALRLRFHPPYDLSDLTELQLSAYNEGKIPTPLSIALKTGEQWVYYESTTQAIQPGAWQRVSFNLSKPIFKSEASNWRHAGPVADLGQVRELQLQIHNGKTDATLLINQIGFQDPE
jgi:hypothetical protein